MEKKNDEARRAARRIEKDRKRLELGSDYESSGDDQTNKDYTDYGDSDYDDSEEEDEYGDEGNETGQTAEVVVENVDSKQLKDKEPNSNPAQNSFRGSSVLDIPFNPVRFLGEALKSLKPETPLMSFYSLGKYDKEISRSVNKRHPAAPGQAASMNERNRQASEEVDVKGVTQSRIPKNSYQPNKYLKPFEEGNDQSQNDMSLNSIAYNRIINKKKAINLNNQAPTDQNLPQGKLVKADDFLKRRDNNESGDMRMSGHGKFIYEKMLHVSKDENQYFNNSKIFTKDGDHKSPYKKQIPSYMRLLEDPKNQKSPYGNQEMVQIVSKNQGWITVSPQNQDRKHPYEKGVIGDAAKTSILTPEWMQTHFPKNKSDHMVQSVERFGLRAENNRTFLVDKQQPQKSVFNYGHVRHNVHSKEMAQEYGKRAIQTEPVRLMEWRENTKRQSYDKPVAGKIGSIYP